MDAKPLRRELHSDRGFTLVELVVCITMIGVFAVVAIPRLYDRSDFENRGFLEATIAGLTLAQKTAITQQRNVCVDFTESSLSLSVAVSRNITAPCDLPFAGPAGPPPYTVKAPGLAAYRSTPERVVFSAQGRPNAGQHISIQDVAVGIVLEEETGYAHK